MRWEHLQYVSLILAIYIFSPDDVVTEEYTAPGIAAFVGEERTYIG